ncbi:hypothetical protein P9173_09900 [Bacillus safensis]|uniref:hypothetical protein n=1 Tax=Bacillus safensis TaxID=561879 RepID=UPI002281FC6F|nr:hypothetical protein [Bacillus safensis]MCY7542386.1 hypothetical protein [Bacillus safensis]MCY7552855.1 hypothetical protein [Bacillus safensis]MCY7644692.1 hypothetical protein [Bacillus safensis]MCY7655993.1 hypothetical protein [Bacillus safensis]MEC3710468.1 hypothetical protein [Bacillus safensis]
MVELHNKMKKQMKSIEEAIHSNDFSKVNRLGISLSNNNEELMQEARDLSNNEKGRYVNTYA